MRLVYRIVLHMSWALSLLLAGWAVLFYLTMIDEINDEVDDSLENYAEMLVTRSLAGRELPAAYAGSNNGYYLTRRAGNSRCFRRFGPKQRRLPARRVSGVCRRAAAYGFQRRGDIYS